MNFYKQKAIKFQFFISLFYSLSYSACCFLACFPASERASDTTIKLLFCAVQLFLLLLLPYFFFPYYFPLFHPFVLSRIQKCFSVFPLRFSCLGTGRFFAKGEELSVGLINGFRVYLMRILLFDRR